MPDGGGRLSVAICGIRGIPACYGGFETFAEELSRRLVERGHRVVVYGRKHFINYSEESYHGVAIRLLAAPRHKYLETPVHTLMSLLDLARRRVDVVLVCNAANSPFVWIARLCGMPVCVNVDGIERKRKKWNALGRWWYRFGELCSVLFASEMISDAEVIRQYYLRTYHRDSEVIRYGHRPGDPSLIEAKCGGTFAGATPPVLAELGLACGHYLLYVSRLEPENNAHVVIAAYNKLAQHLPAMPLVIVGDAPYAGAYIARLKKNAVGSVIFAGYRFGAAYEDLQTNAYLYIQATEVGGTHPALVEAMGYANCIVANDTPENREVLGDAGFYYAKNDEQSLERELRILLDDSQLCTEARNKAVCRARELFTWDQITTSYERLFQRLK